MSVPTSRVATNTPPLMQSLDDDRVKLSNERIGAGLLSKSQRERKEPPMRKSKSEMAPDMCKSAGKKASLYGKDFDKHSALAQQQQARHKVTTTLRWSDLEVGQLLGSGTFCHVYEVSLREKEPPPPPPFAGKGELAASNASLDLWELFSKSGIARHDDTTTTGEDTSPGTASSASSSRSYNNHKTVPPKSFALKHLDPHYLKGKHDFADCAIDLVMEAKILGCLSHPNVIKLYAVTGGSVSKVFTRKGGYFLLLERLHGALDERIRNWADADISSASKRDRAKKLEDRLKSVAVGVARGMKYLHKNKVIYRDLKPSNVGFTLSGDVKIFDFGLAREMADEDRKLTGYTGSARYMAPEVARCDNYGLPADVYSFAILLWELCSLQKAFSGMTKEEHLESVVGAKVRPKLSAIEGSSSLKKLIQSCWDHDPDQRPNFSEIRDQLCFELDFLESAQESAKVNRFMRLRKQRRGSSSGNKEGKTLASLLFGNVDNENTEKK